MGRMLNIVTLLRKRSKREYLPRMVDNKLEAVAKAKQYGADYWDGDRRYGYGGYKYDGRWILSPICCWRGYKSASFWWWARIGRQARRTVA